jgi:hypothetical protein
MLLLPETLEMSKVCSILSEEFCFKLDELFALKEIQKFAASTDELLEILKQVENEGILKPLNLNEFQVILKEEDVIYNLANLPPQYNKADIIHLLGLKNEDVKRIYKQSLFWILVIENAEANRSLQTLLNSKSVKVNDIEIKFDFIPGKNLKKAILKKTHHLNYIKETDDLKASPQGKRKESYNKTGYNSNTSNTSDHFSWRKKSDVSNNSKEE